MKSWGWYYKIIHDDIFNHLFYSCYGCPQTTTISFITFLKIIIQLWYVISTNYTRITLLKLTLIVFIPNFVLVLVKYYTDLTTLLFTLFCYIFSLLLTFHPLNPCPDLNWHYVNITFIKLQLLLYLLSNLPPLSILLISSSDFWLNISSLLAFNNLRDLTNHYSCTFFPSFHP